MDRCSKIKLFNLVILFCIANFFIYRIFSGPSPSPFWQSRSLKPTIEDVIRTETPQAKTPVESPQAKAPVESPQAKTPVESPQAKTPVEPPPGNHQTLINISTNTSLKSNLGVVTNAAKPDNSVPQTNPESKKTEITKTSKDPPVSAGAKIVPLNTTKVVASSQLPPCPLVPPGLNGPLATYTDAPEHTKIAELNKGLRKGGRYWPPDCISRHRVAIVIPYRNREHHLKVFLHNLHPMLMRQQLDYGVYVIDQALPGRFNRAMLMNIGYAEAMKRYDYQCAIFHDVDLLPENDKNIYSCPEQPRHLSAAINKFGYRLPYGAIFGGASALRKEHMEKVNGFSNLYFGWGGEDDDMSQRIRGSGLTISRYPMEIARYKMIKHTKEKHNEVNPERYRLLKNVKQRMPKDGLSTLEYTVQEVEEAPTHTRIKVFIDEAAISKKS